MPRMLCLGGLVVAGLVLLLFLVDLIMTLGGMGSLFRYPSMMMDVAFMICSGILGYLAWSSLREIK